MGFFRKKDDEETKVVSTEKFLKADDLQTAELKKIISECISFIKEQTHPALELLTPATAEKLTNQFLLEKKAEFLLDEKAIEDGYESEADRQHEIAMKQKEKEAKEKAEAEAKAKAAKEEEDRIFAEEVATQKKIQELRDKEDADRAAELKAKLKAQDMGRAATGLS